MKIRALAMLAAVSFILIVYEGCTDQKELNEIKNEIDQLKRTVERLDKSNTNYLIRLSELEDQYKNIYLDTSSTTYQRLDSNLGSFFIVLEVVKPYADGYKLILLIGNPYFIRIAGCTLSIEWGRDFDPNNDDYNEWLKSLRKKEEKISENLYPGCWNKVELIISPAKKEEIAHLKLSMRNDAINLLEKPYQPLMSPVRK